MKKSRRSFLKNLAQGSAVVAIGGAGLGFTSQGIASGSVATTMMATEAAAGGGGV